MRGFAFAAAMLAMVNALQAKEAASPRGEVRSSVEPTRQLATSSNATSRSDAERPSRSARRSADFSAERIIPDICTGC